MKTGHDQVEMMFIYVFIVYINLSNTFGSKFVSSRQHSLGFIQTFWRFLDFIFIFIIVKIHF